MEKIRVLVADDHPVFLEGLCTVLNLKADDLQVISQVTNGIEAVEKARELRPDVALLDIIMPLLDGVEAAKRIHQESPNTKIVMLTTYDDRDLISGALEAGAKGYVLKDAPVEDVIYTVRAAHRGDVHFSGKVADKLPWGEGKYSDKASLKDAYRIKELEPLTDREREVFYLLSRGMTNVQIADELSLSEKTVRNYVSRIYEIIGVHERAQLVIWAMQHGIH